jgi:predicted permease
MVARVPILTLLGRSHPLHGARVSRWRGVLVVTQVALALVLLCGATLLYRSLSRLTAVDVGYERSGIVSADVMLYVPMPQVQQFYATTMPRVRSLAGVEAAGLIQSTPLTGKWTFSESIQVEGGLDGPSVQAAGSFVAYDYFAAMRIPVLAGRTFTEAELTRPNAPVILNEIAAAVLFHGENPVGRRVHLGGRAKPREVIGVVKATRDVALERAAEPQYYEPGLFGDSQLIVRVTGDPDGFGDTLRGELTAADPRLIIHRIQPLEAIAEEQVFERRIIGRLLAGFAATAFLLAIAGLFGVTHANTVQRRHELGLRAALGARPADLLMLTLRSALTLVARGIVAGAVGAIFFGDLLRSLLFETRPIEWTVIAGASLLLAGITLMAASVPALRAARVDPLQVLRTG